ncbi:MAG: adenylate/guanylate cyclase domain-containing protein [Candidatus Binatia bacterium]
MERPMDISDIKYARSGDLNIAYQRFGSGPDVVIIPGLVCNVELAWEHEVYRRTRERIGKYVRVLEFDKRGMASSDRFDEAPTLEQRIDDIKAVMDAEGIERAHVLGLSEGGIMGQLFAAMHPERVDRLVLVNSMIGASALRDLKRRDDDPPMRRSDVLAHFNRMIDGWGRAPEHFVDLFAPSKNDDPAFIRWVGRFQRQTCSRADIRRQFESVLGLDANDRLGHIRAPTLVMNVIGDRLIPPAFGRYLAEHIPGARFVPFPGEDHISWVMPNWRELMDVWIEFVIGRAPVAQSERRFATVLFTDIVSSTARSAEVGDEAWREMLDRHDRIAWQAVDRHAGKLVKNMGDGLLMTFTTPSEALACATELVGELGRVGLSVRAGLHAGEIMVREDGDVTGLAVNLAARVQQAATGGATWVSSTVRDLLLGGDWSFTERGEHVLKGIEGAWRLYELAA